jgi:hypothetical protein
MSTQCPPRWVGSRSRSKWVRVSFSERQRGRPGTRWARFTQICEFMQQAHNPASALHDSVTPPPWLRLTACAVLIDPIWDQRAGPMQWAGPKRSFQPPLPLDDLPAIDAVLISHDHYDHLGAGTVKRLAQMDAVRQARWIATLGVGAILETLGVDPSRCPELNWTENAKVGSVTVSALPARHLSGRNLFRVVALKRWRPGTNSS